MFISLTPLLIIRKKKKSLRKEKSAHLSPSHSKKRKRKEKRKFCSPLSLPFWGTGGAIVRQIGREIPSRENQKQKKKIYLATNTLKLNWFLHQDLFLILPMIVIDSLIARSSSSSVNMAQHFTILRSPRLSFLSQEFHGEDRNISFLQNLNGSDWQPGTHE